MSRFHGLRALAFALIAVLFAALGTGCGARSVGPRYASDIDNLKENVRLTFRVDAVGPVRLTGAGSHTGNWQGTSVVIHESGLLATNKHVVENATELSIAILERGKTVYYPATVVAVSKTHDLAVVKIPRTFDAAVSLADDDDVAMLAEVYTAGFPRHLHMTGARGEIARVGVTDDTTSDVRDDMLVYIEGGPGSSGSGIFLTDGGELVGLVKMTWITGKRDDMLLGALVAEPVTHIRAFLKEKKIPFHD